MINAQTGGIFFLICDDHPALHSFPTRRSSDLFGAEPEVTEVRIWRKPVFTRPSPERSEEHTSELQSHSDLVCRLLLEKKKSAKRRSRYRTRTSTAANRRRSWRSTSAPIPWPAP